MSGLVCDRITVPRGDRLTVDSVSFAAPRPQLIGLIGPNGAGKSTLMRAVAGLLPASGTAVWNGEDLTAMSPARRARALAFMPQERTVHWPLACREVVMLARLPYQGAFAGPSAADRRAVAEALAAMSVDGFADRAFDTLSGGEQARVLIARMLAQDPDLLIADEPASGLDPAHQIALMQVFRDIVAGGRSVLVSLHDLSLASRWCDRLLLMDQGRLVADGTPEEVMTADRMARVYGIAVRPLTIGGSFAVVPEGLAPSASAQTSEVMPIEEEGEGNERCLPRIA
ncbi:ABC transporter ATP-binding protein [Stappia taiwanensis]|uniref:ABC transporter ATP-binding protein n=1 Tax=Stappia taiwanensis TaxID=992267 RepID=A0A838Y1H9_9HYPH|nr:ABC transporter ATP-binding protein [Stappia taiwanensis]MBA4613074.1 ABC transporter ATP-binding protein [Stappia taiwanensis]GGF01449.1 ABC transporter [Stappia taiwanensis]